MLTRITRFAVVVALLICTQQLLACETETTGFSANFRGTTAFTGGDLNDLGAISMDANNGGQWPTDCAKLAHDHLLQKLKTTPNSAFQQSLAGYYVALIFAAATRLGSQGWFNTAWDPDPMDPTDTLAGQLNRVLTSYQVISHAGGCGQGFSGNSCMDDHAGAAAAYGWMSAYKKKRGDTDTWYYAQTTGDYIAAFFNNVCIYNSSAPGSTDVYNFCNGTMAQLAAGQAEAFPFEHGFESPHYGFGLLTSIAQAITGLEASGAGYALSVDQKTKARALMANMQKHTNTTTFNFKSNNCRRPAWSGTYWYIASNIMGCEDFGEGGYNPHMYHLAEFFQAPPSGHVGSPPAGAYQSDDFCCATYSGWNLGNFEAAYGYGRYATYHEQAYTWYVARGNQYSPRYMPFDNNPAQGYLDAVDNNGLAYGWACDADAPNYWVKVDLYANGSKIPDTIDQYAWWDSVQPEINQLCGGGTAHRFWIQLPWGVQGQQITAKARDYTFRPAVSLPCVTECVW